MCFWRAAGVSARYPDTPPTAITATLLATTAVLCSGWSVVCTLQSCSGGGGASGGVNSGTSGSVSIVGGGISSIVGSGGLNSVHNIISCLAKDWSKVLSAMNPLSSRQGLYVLLGLLYSAICATGYFYLNLIPTLILTVRKPPSP